RSAAAAGGPAVAALPARRAAEEDGGDDRAAEDEPCERQHHRQPSPEPRLPPHGPRDRDRSPTDDRPVRGEAAEVVAAAPELACEGVHRRKTPGGILLQRSFDGPREPRREVR